MSDNHSCPVCRCKWNPDHSNSQWEEMAANTQRLASEVRVLKKRISEIKGNIVG